MILCTFPGRHGDLLWALPTIQAISTQAGAPLDLLIAGEFRGLVPLLAAQPYLRNVYALMDWPADARVPPTLPIVEYAQIYHLGYSRWPELPLPLETLWTALQEYDLRLTIDLSRPWIHAPADVPVARRDVVFGWTDCHFELKYGLTELLFPDADEEEATAMGLCPDGSRWVTEGGYRPTTWVEAAAWITAAKVVLTDCSALHVLAAGLGIPVVMVEPMEARWNGIFYPLGKTGRAVHLVTGLDGRPTYDARHVRAAIDAALGVPRG